MNKNFLLLLVPLVLMFGFLLIRTPKQSQTASVANLTTPVIFESSIEDQGNIVYGIIPEDGMVLLD